MKKIFIFSLLFIALLSCSKKESMKADKVNEIEINKEEPKTVNVKEELTPPSFRLKKASYEQVAKFTVYAIFNQENNKTLKVSNDNEVYHVSYTRKDDNTKWSVKIKFVDSRIIWGNSDGRWRDDSRDEKIYFEEKENEVLIKQFFTDGSIDTKSYKI